MCLMDEKKARPADKEGVQSAADFHAYLQRYHLVLLDVSIESQVRYMTVWNIACGIPVRRSHADLVRAGLQKMTGVPYQAAIKVLPAN